MPYRDAKDKFRIGALDDIMLALDDHQVNVFNLGFNPNNVRYQICLRNKTISWRMGKETSINLRHNWWMVNLLEKLDVFGKYIQCTRYPKAIAIRNCQIHGHWQILQGYHA